VENRRKSENLAIVMMLTAAGVILAWLIAHFAVEDVFGAREMPILLISAAVGAGAAGVLVAPWFGRRGFGGWALAGCAAFLATEVGAVMSGALFYGLDRLVDPYDGVLVVPEPGLFQSALFAAAFVFAVLGLPAVGGPWLAMMAGIQLVARSLRG
jgi:hypothetical protein